MHKKVKHYAKKHEKAHDELKKRVRRHQHSNDSILKTFFIAFILLFIALVITRATAEYIREKNPQSPTPAQISEVPKTNGSKIAAISHQRIHQLSERMAASRINSISGHGSLIASYTNKEIGKVRTIEKGSDLLINSLWLTNHLSTGQSMTRLNQSKAKLLQKSLLATYYLGEKTITINGVIQNDTRLLSQMTNVLSVDLYQYLDQAIIRSDALDDYIHLLQASISNGQKRAMELSQQINFLQSNSTQQENALKISEETFFNNIKSLNGPNAEQELGKFIGIQENQSETKAKLGAYQSLKDYYEFLIPQAQSLLREIQLNREAIIAGVQVTEIRNGRLPLIKRAQ